MANIIQLLKSTRGSNYGMLEKWKVGKMEFGKNGKLEWRNSGKLGILERWNSSKR